MAARGWHTVLEVRRHSQHRGRGSVPPSLAPLATYSRTRTRYASKGMIEFRSNKAACT